MNLFYAEQLARRLMNEHRLGCQWGFRFSQAKSIFGTCDYAEQYITLSAPMTLLNSEDIVRDTILHEIAHAKAGPKSGHNRVWRAIARAIGCNGLRCCTQEVVTPPKKFEGKCPGCGKIVWSHRRTRGSCLKCSKDAFNPEYLLTWKRLTCLPA